MRWGVSRLRGAEDGGSSFAVVFGERSGDEAGVDRVEVEEEAEDEAEDGCECDAERRWMGWVACAGRGSMLMGTPACFPKTAARARETVERGPWRTMHSSPMLLPCQVPTLWTLRSTRSAYTSQMPALPFATWM